MKKDQLPRVGILAKGLSTPVFKDSAAKIVDKWAFPTYDYPETQGHEDIRNK